jgi:hypothetical protein
MCPVLKVKLHQRPFVLSPTSNGQAGMGRMPGPIPTLLAGLWVKVHVL